jgi:nucleoside-diphosphate-sugar epimerase
MRVLVTGATGGLGRNAVEALISRGASVRATGRRKSVGAQLQAIGAEFTALDLSTATPQALDDLLLGVDVVWHTAALSSPWGRDHDFVAANATATKHLLAAAARQGARRFVHISTPALYFDYTDRRNVPETFCAASPVNMYAWTKAQAEAAVQDAVQQWPHLHCTVLRPRAIFGPHDQVLLPRLTRLLDQRKGHLPLPRAGLVTLDLTYVGNVVQALWLTTFADAQQVPTGTAINITNHEPVVLREVLHALYVQALGRPLNIVPVPWAMLSVIARSMEICSRITGREPLLTAYSVGALSFDMTLDNTKARELLGYRPEVSMTQALQRTAQWMQTHG